jgi:heme/copper-type cytochrome/quinol oxidase subunit 2
MLDDDDEKPLDPQAARAVAQVRSLMMIASITTFVAVAVVVGVIGYRVFKSEGSAQPAPDMTLALPAGAKVISSAVGDGRIVLTIEVAGAFEMRIFDLNSLKPLGRIRLTSRP